MAPLNADAATIDSLYDNFCLFEFPYTQLPPENERRMLSSSTAVNHSRRPVAVIHPHRWSDENVDGAAPV
jgi:hypothetical protein